MDIPEKSKQIDTVNFQQKQIQYMNELATKRIKVEELQKELDTANRKIHQLSRSLEVAERKTKEYEFNFNLTLKNVHFLEDYVQSKRESSTRNCVERDVAVNDNKTLRQLFQESQLENYNLRKEIEEAKSQHQYDVAYQQQLLDNDQKIREQVAQLKVELQDYQTDRTELDKIAVKIDKQDELTKTIEFYMKQYYKAIEDNRRIEEKFLFADAALKSFDVSSKRAPLIHANEIEILIEQWEKTINSYTEQDQIQKKLIEDLTGNLNTEREINKKLCVLQSQIESEDSKTIKKSVDDVVEIN